jgi:hypothetical protein
VLAESVGRKIKTNALINFGRTSSWFCKWELSGDSHLGKASARLSCGRCSVQRPVCTAGAGRDVQEPRRFEEVDTVPFAPAE